MSVSTLGMIAFIAFLAAAFFAGAETAIIASDRIRLRHLSAKGDRRARLVLQYLKNPEYFLSIVLVGTNLGVIGCTSTFTAVMIHYLGDSGATVATLILVPTLLLLQEIIPKGIFLYYADHAAVLSILPLRAFAVSMYPIIKSFSELTNFLVRALRVKRIDRKVTMTMEELLFHLRSSRKEGLISEDTMTLASRAYGMVTSTAKDIMVPMENVVWVEEGKSLEDYVRVFASERFSRLPVYSSTRGRVVGFMSIHNLLRARGTGRDKAKLESPYVVREDTPIVTMLVRMKTHGVHMAMIRDMKGDLAGMATLEDILERLVGAIADEFH